MSAPNLLHTKVVINNHRSSNNINNNNTNGIKRPTFSRFSVLFSQPRGTVRERQWREGILSVSESVTCLRRLPASSDDAAAGDFSLLFSSSHNDAYHTQLKKKCGGDVASSSRQRLLLLRRLRARREALYSCVDASCDVVCSCRSSGLSPNKIFLAMRAAGGGRRWAEGTTIALTSAWSCQIVCALELPLCYALDDISAAADGDGDYGYSGDADDFSKTSNADAGGGGGGGGPLSRETKGEKGGGEDMTTTGDYCASSPTPRGATCSSIQQQLQQQQQQRREPKRQRQLHTPTNFPPTLMVNPQQGASFSSHHCPFPSSLSTLHSYPTHHNIGCNDTAFQYHNYYHPQTSQMPSFLPSPSTGTSASSLSLPLLPSIQNVGQMGGTRIDTNNNMINNMNSDVNFQCCNSRFNECIAGENDAPCQPPSFGYAAPIRLSDLKKRKESTDNSLTHQSRSACATSLNNRINNNNNKNKNGTNNNNNSNEKLICSVTNATNNTSRGCANANEYTTENYSSHKTYYDNNIITTDTSDTSVFHNDSEVNDVDSNSDKREEAASDRNIYTAVQNFNEDLIDLVDEDDSEENSITITSGRSNNNKSSANHPVSITHAAATISAVSTAETVAGNAHFSAAAHAPVDEWCESTPEGKGKRSNPQQQHSPSAALTTRATSEMTTNAEGITSIDAESLTFTTSTTAASFAHTTPPNTSNPTMRPPPLFLGAKRTREDILRELGLS